MRFLECNASIDMFLDKIKYNIFHMPFHVCFILAFGETQMTNLFTDAPCDTDCAHRL